MMHGLANMLVKFSFTLSDHKS